MSKRRLILHDGGGIRDFFNGIKAGYSGVSKAGQLASAYTGSLNKKNPPPLPKKPERQQGVKIVTPAAAPAAQTFAPSGIGFIDKARKYKPLGTIDSILGDLGVRDKIRNKLGSSTIGKHILAATDTAISQGFGRRRRVKRRGGSKSRKRVIRKRMGGSKSSKRKGGSKRRIVRRRY